MQILEIEVTFITSIVKCCKNKADSALSTLKSIPNKRATT